jgi:hypothetical protein
MTEPEPLVIKVNAQLTAEQLRQFEAMFEDGSLERHRARFLTDEDEA